MTDYSIDYFLAKFEAIPEEEWCTDQYSDSGAHCAMGHAGAKEGMPLPPEARALQDIFLAANMCAANINDTGYSRDSMYPQPTPKQRILAALRDIKAGQNGKEL